MAAGGARRRKRILLVVACAALVAVGFGAWYQLNQSRLDRRAKEAGAAGRVALANGDWERALDGIGQYLRRFMGRGATAEDLLLYGRARRHIESPNGRHLTEALDSVRKAVEMDPSNAEAKRELLDLYFELGYATEALELIDSMLAAAPADPPLLRLKCEMLEARRQFAAALEVAKQLNARAPDDLDGLFTTLRLLVESQTLAADVDAWIDGVIATHAADARFELLRACALTRRHDEANAKQSLDRALAAATSPDPVFLRLLIAELDAAERFEDSLAVLERHEGALEPSLLREYVRRLWYSGRLPDAPPSLWERDAVRSDPEMSALHALSLVVAGRSKEAAPRREALSRRDDKTATAWAAFVEHWGADGAAKPGAAAALSAAVEVVPRSAILRQALGDAYAALGESELAVESWTAASAGAPAWAVPWRRRADAMIATGQEHLAPALAWAAVRRAPSDLAAILTYVRCTAAIAGELDRKRLDALIQAVASLQAQAPEQTDEILPVYVGLLLRVDKSAAEQRMREALASKTAPSEATLLRLYELAQRAGVTFGSSFLDMSESVHGVTPQLAFAKALARADSAGDDAGLKLLDDLRGRARDGAKDLDWDLMRASYLDAVHRPDAGPAWIALADAHPSERAPQLGALASAAAWTDREAISRIIDRVRVLTADQGVTWRLARARWTLSAPTATEAEIADTARILNDVTRTATRSVTARVLLAQSLERLGNLPGAEDQLRLASELAPNNTWIALEVARVAQRQDRPEVARRELDRVLTAPDLLVPEQIERAAYLLALQGDLRRSADLLEPLMTPTQTRRDGTVLLAKLYRNLGQAERAVALCERLLAHPDPEVIEIAAGLYASLGRDADVRTTLERLDHVRLRSGDRELVRARFESAWGSQQAARDAFRSAVKAAPERADAWTAYLGNALMTGDAESINSVLDDPKAASVEAVQFLRGARPLCIASLDDGRQRALFFDMIDDKANRKVLLDAVRAVQRDSNDPADPLKAARTIAGLAEANVRVLPLQLLAADLCASSGMSRRACEIAQRAAREFPNSGAASQSAAECFAKAGKWSDVIPAALAWRDKATGRAQFAELLIADAELRVGRAADAEERLKHWIDAARSSPTENAVLLIDYAIALARRGATTEAADVLAVPIGKSERCRTLAYSVETMRLGDSASVRSWCRVLESLPGSREPRYRLMVAREWAAAWQRFADPALLQSARSILGELLETPDAPAEAPALAAMLSQKQGDLPAARRDYEAALKRNPGLIGVRNNLAVVLADLGEWRAATDEATAAAKAAPRSGECYDTLAYAWRKAKQFDKAGAALEEAIRAEPTNPAWIVSLAETFAEGGREADVVATLGRLDALESQGAEIPDDLRSRVDRLRSKSH